MATGFIAIIGGLLALAGQLIAEHYKNAPERRRKADALANLELAETRTAMATADRQLDGMQQPGQQPILLSPDDHL